MNPLPEVAIKYGSTAFSASAAQRRIADMRGGSGGVHTALRLATTSILERGCWLPGVGTRGRTALAGRVHSATIGGTNSRPDTTFNIRTLEACRLFNSCRFSV